MSFSSRPWLEWLIWPFLTAFGDVYRCHRFPSALGNRRDPCTEKPKSLVTGKRLMQLLSEHLFFEPFSARCLIRDHSVTAVADTGELLNCFGHLALTLDQLALFQSFGQPNHKLSKGGDDCFRCLQLWRNCWYHTHYFQLHKGYALLYLALIQFHLKFASLQST